MSFQKYFDRIGVSFRKKPVKSVVIVILLAVALIPIISMISMLARYSVNAPFWDQWEYVFLIDKFHAGTLTIADLWAQHNEHRMIFPRIVTIGLSEFTNYNIRYEILMNFITASITFSLLMVMLKKTFGKLNIATALLVLIFAWVFYSPLQWINWIWGFQLAFFMGVLFAVLSIWFIVKLKPNVQSKLFYVAILTAFIGTYCVGNGLVIWGVGLVLLLLQRIERRRIYIWLIAFAVSAASYLYHFHRAPGSPTLIEIAKEPVAVLKYLVTYLGRSLAWTPTGARYTGLALLLTFIVALYIIYKKGQFSKILMWLGLALYVIFTSLVAAISRLNFGVNQAASDSYTTMSALFILSTFVMVFYASTLAIKGVNKNNVKLVLTGAFLLGMLAIPVTHSFIHNYSYGVGQLEGQSADMLKIQRCIYSATSPNSACLIYAEPNKAQAYQGIQILKKLKWGYFENYQK
jgi:hypothetical protein